MRTSAAPPVCVDILIAEDDGPLRTSLRYLLEQQGYTCAEAGNGREAVELARHFSPQCVLLDLSMPELDGFSVARKLRSDPRTRSARIHCLTGKMDPRSREQALQAGCDVFLPKPVDVPTLLEVVRRPPARRSECWVCGLTRTQAEDWLDWLESNGYPPGEVFFQGDSGFAVRCHQRAGA